MTPRQNILEKLPFIPQKPGVYQYFDDEGTIIYVGKAKNLKNRVSSYFQKNDQNYKTRRLVSEIRDLKFIITDSEQDAFLLENNLIKKHQPKYNILLKDGKSYPKILITNEDFPRVLKIRNTKNVQGEIYGPFTFGYTLDLIMEIINQLYPLRTCKQKLEKQKIEEGKYKICLKYHIKKCCGICENKTTQETYLGYIDNIRKIIKGNAQEIIKDLEKQLKIYSEKLLFEQANRINNKIELLERFKNKTVITENNIKDLDVFGYDETEKEAYISMLKIHNGSIVQGQVIEYKKRMAESKETILSHAIVELRGMLKSDAKEILVPFKPEVLEKSIATCKIPLLGDKKKILDIAQQTTEEYKKENIRISDKINPENKYNRILEKLQKLLLLSKKPECVESFDISNLQGTNSTGCCVVYKNGRPSKKDYKRYIIKSVTSIDDYESTKEVVRRRYTRMLNEHTPLPDLIIADGGAGHMHAIKEVVKNELGQEIPVLGLKKNKHHKTNTLVYGEDAREISLDVKDELFHWLAQIQDEVHRFTISFHRERRSKKQVASELNEIKGIGTKTATELLKAFKSVKQIRETSIEELQRVCGKSKAEIVYKHFQNEEI